MSGNVGYFVRSWVFLTPYDLDIWLHDLQNLIGLSTHLGDLPLRKVKICPYVRKFLSWPRMTFIFDYMTSKILQDWLNILPLVKKLPTGSKVVDLDYARPMTPWPPKSGRSIYPYHTKSCKNPPIHSKVIAKTKLLILTVWPWPLTPRPLNLDRISTYLGDLPYSEILMEGVPIFSD